MNLLTYLLTSSVAELFLNFLLQVSRSHTSGHSAEARCWTYPGLVVDVRTFVDEKSPDADITVMRRNM